MVKTNYLRIAKKSAGIQISELKKINKVFNKTFLKAVDTIANCKGKIIFTGQGKSGKQASSVSSTSGTWRCSRTRIEPAPLPLSSQPRQ